MKIKMIEIFYNSYKNNIKEWQYMFNNHKLDVYNELLRNENASKFKYKNLEDWLKDVNIFLNNNKDYYERVFIFKNENDKILGSMTFIPISKANSEATYCIDVHPNYRGKNIAYYMFLLFLNKINKTETWVEKLIADIWYKNKSSINFHNKLSNLFKTQKIILNNKDIQYKFFIKTFKKSNVDKNLFYSNQFDKKEINKKLLNDEIKVINNILKESKEKIKEDKLKKKLTEYMNKTIKIKQERDKRTYQILFTKVSYEVYKLQYGV